MPTQYTIVKNINNKANYFSFPGQFQPELKKAMCFKFPPVLHLAGLVELGNKELKIATVNAD